MNPSLDAASNHNFNESCLLFENGMKFGRFFKPDIKFIAESDKTNESC